MPLEPDILQPFARLAWILDRQHGPANRAIPNIEKMSFDVAHVRIGYRVLFQQERASDTVRSCSPSLKLQPSEARRPPRARLRLRHRGPYPVSYTHLRAHETDSY